MNQQYLHLYGALPVQDQTRGLAGAWFLRDSLLDRRVWPDIPVHELTNICWCGAAIIAARKPHLLAETDQNGFNSDLLVGLC